jgi:hypothetical protein
MSDLLGRVSGFDPVSSLLALPMWAAGTLAAVAFVCCLFAFRRASYEGMTGTVARVALVLIGAGVAWVLVGASPTRDGSADRRALDARVTELTARAIAPGSALACLDAAAGAAVEGACEKALFATPEATAAAVSYVSAQLALLADASDYAQRDATYAPLVAQLRRAAETDRFGIVAHVLAAREGCSAEQCDAYALLNDTTRVSANITERTYESYVERHVAGWPAASIRPMASTTPPAGAMTASNAAPGLPTRPPGPNVFFPSADSIPPVTIMNPEPPAPAPAATPAPAARQTTTGSGAPRPVRQSNRKAAPAPTPLKPVDLTSEAARAAPAHAPAVE